MHIKKFLTIKIFPDENNPNKKYIHIFCYSNRIKHVYKKRYL